MSNKQKTTKPKKEAAEIKNTEESVALEGLRKSLPGITYQLKILMLLALDSYSKQYKFDLETEIKGAGKFDDCILGYGEKNKPKKYRFIQAKHRSTQGKQNNSRKEIAWNNLFPDLFFKQKPKAETTKEKKDDFKIIKYFESYLEIKNNPNFKDKELESFIIWTNIGLKKGDKLNKENDTGGYLKKVNGKYLECPAESKSSTELGSLFKELDKGSDLLKIESINQGTCYQLDISNSFFISNLQSIFVELINSYRKKIDSYKLAKELINVLENKKMHITKKETPMLYKYSDFLFEKKIIISGCEISKVKGYQLKLSSEIVKNLKEDFYQNNNPADSSDIFLNIFSICFKDEDKSLDILDNIMETQKRHFKKTLNETESSLSESFYYFPSEKDLTDFFEKLIFFLNQPNEDELGDILQEKMNKLHNYVDAIEYYNSLSNEMLNWMKQSHSKAFTNDQLKREFNEQTSRMNDWLIQGTSLYYKKKLKNFEYFNISYTFNQCGITNFIEGNDKKILKIDTECTRLAMMKITNILHQTSRQDSFLINNLKILFRFKEEILKQWKETEKLSILLIEVDRALENDIQQFIETLKTDILTNKKIIFVVKKDFSNNFDKFLEIDDFNILEKIEKQITFSELNDEGKRAIKSKKISFGNESYGIEDFLGNGLINDLKDEALLELIDSDSNLRISYKDDSEEKSQLEKDIEEKGLYVSRNFSRQINFKIELLKERMQDIFFIDSIDIEKLRELICEDEKEPSNNPKFNDDGTRFFYKNDNDKADIFYNNLKKSVLNSEQSISLHWLSYEDQDEKLVWKETHGSVANLRNYFIEDGDRPEENEALFIESDSKIKIITAEPGMGKTTLINHLRRNGNSDSFQWNIQLKLINHRKVFKNLIDGNNCLDSLIKMLEFTPKALGSEIFKHHLIEKGNVTLLFDGFDEIEESEQQNFLNLLHDLKETETILAKIIVTGRLHVGEKLEDSLSTIAYILKPLEEKDQKKALFKFLKYFIVEEVDEKLGTYCDSLFETFKISIQDNLFNFTGIPLHMYMLATVYQEQAIKYVKHEINDPEPINILELYTKFIDIKYDILFEQKIQLNSKKVIDKEAIINFSKKGFLDSHRKLAFYLLFDKDIKEFFGKNKGINFEKLALNRLGLVEGVSHENFNFIHRTFAEYFVADLFFSRLKKNKDDSRYKVSCPFILKEIFKDKNKVIHSFLKEINKNQTSISILEEKDLLFPLRQDQDRNKKILELDYKTLDENKTFSQIKELDDDELKEKFKGYVDQKDGYQYIKNRIYKIKKNSKFYEGFIFLLELASVTSFNKFKDYILEKIKEKFSNLFIELIELIEKNDNNEIENLLEKISSIKKEEEYRNYPSYERIEYLKTELEKKLKITKIYFSLEKNEIKNKLIEGKHWDILGKLIKYQKLKLTKEDIQRIFEDINSIRSLENDGTEVIKKLNSLNKQIVKFFNKKLYLDKIDGCNPAYERRILEQMAFPLLKRIEKSKDKNIQSIEPLALINLINSFISYDIYFVVFSNRKDSYPSHTIKNTQLETIFILIQKLLTEEFVTAQQLKISINCIITLAKAAHLKLIDINNKLLILDPSGEFEFKFNDIAEDRQMIIIELIREFNQRINSILENEQARTQKRTLVFCNETDSTDDICQQAALTMSQIANHSLSIQESEQARKSCLDSFWNSQKSSTNQENNISNCLSTDVTQKSSRR